jgi:hypothetical protein
MALLDDQSRAGPRLRGSPRICRPALATTGLVAGASRGKAREASYSVTVRLRRRSGSATGHVALSARYPITPGMRVAFWRSGHTSIWISGNADMALSSHQQGAKARVLLRRLMVTRPITGVSVDTGYELMAISTFGRGPQVLVDCLECGQDHPWRIEDAFLE